MGTTVEKLIYLQETKEAIKNAIVEKGVEVPEGTTFRAYAQKVGEIKGGLTESDRFTQIPTNETRPYIKGNATVAYAGYPIFLQMQGMGMSYNLIINIYGIDNIQYEAFQGEYSRGEKYANLTEKVTYSKNGSGSVRNHSFYLNVGGSSDPVIQTQIQLNEETGQLTFTNTYANERKYGVMVCGYVPK